MNGEVEIMQNIFIGFVAEADILEADFATMARFNGARVNRLDLEYQWVHRGGH